jgi:hypothetical protein
MTSRKQKAGPSLRSVAFRMTTQATKNAPEYEPTMRGGAVRFGVASKPLNPLG